MKKLVLAAAAATVLCTTSGLAADLKPVLKAPPAVEATPSPWDWAFGGALMSDYNFRGISQSNRGPSVTAYSETRYNVNSNWQLYAGSQYWAVTLPTNPTCECDLYGGIRPTFGPVAFDFGYIYYWYPKERQHADVLGAPFPAFPNGNSTLRQTDYWEVYGKVTWELLKDRFAVGANVYYSPSWLHTGAFGTYASVTAKLTMPSVKLSLGVIDELGWYVSGEAGRYWLGTTNFVPGVFSPAINLPDYTTWNLGLAFTWKVATFDIRYYDTDLSKVQCNLLTGDPNAILTAGGLASKWCNASIVGALKFDLTALTNLK
jgi:uncharacterized protein (TIGR02001 family)